MEYIAGSNVNNGADLGGDAFVGKVDGVIFLAFRGAQRAVPAGGLSRFFSGSAHAAASCVQPNAESECDTQACIARGGEASYGRANVQAPRRRWKPTFGDVRSV